MRKHGCTPSRRDKHVTLAGNSPPGVARGRFVGGQRSGLAGCKPPPLFTRGASSCLSQGRRQGEPRGASPRPSAPTYLPADLQIQQSFHCGCQNDCHSLQKWTGVGERCQRYPLTEVPVPVQAVQALFWHIVGHGQSAVPTTACSLTVKVACPAATVKGDDCFLAVPAPSLQKTPPPFSFFCPVSPVPSVPLQQQFP